MKRISTHQTTWNKLFRLDHTTAHYAEQRAESHVLLGSTTKYIMYIHTLDHGVTVTPLFYSVLSQVCFFH